MMGVYYDSIYGTFAFAPIEIPAGALRGLVVDKDQKPVANTAVVLKAGNKTYRTITNLGGAWTLPQKVKGECVVQTGNSPGKTVPDCSNAGAIKLSQ